MATHILPKPSLQTIRQFDLARFVSRQNQLEALKKEQEQLSAEIQAALSSGALVEPGTHVARLESFERRSVAWKDVVIRLKGEGYANNVLQHTKASVHTKLVIR